MDRESRVEVLTGLMDVCLQNGVAEMPAIAGGSAERAWEIVTQWVAATASPGRDFSRASEFFEANLDRLRFSQLGSILAPIKKINSGSLI